MSLPKHIVDRINDELARSGGRGIDVEARAHGAIALMGTIGSIWMLRPDGTLWDADTDWGKPLTPLSAELRFMALATGAKRFPWLRELLPERPAKAKECSTCGGRGEFVPANALPGSGGVLCSHCNCLGWLPE